MRQVLYSIVNVILQTFFGLFVLFFVARFYPTKDIGIYYFVISIGSFVSLFTELGIGNIILAKLRRNHMNYFLSFFLFSIFFYFLGALALFLLSKEISTLYSTLQEYVYLAIIYSLSYFMRLFFENCFLSLELVNISSLFSLFSNILRSLIIILPFLGMFHFNYFTLILSLFLYNTLFSLFSLFYILYKFRIPLVVKFDFIKDLPNYSLIGFFYNATNFLDILIIKYFLPYEQVALYKLATSLVSRVSTISKSFDALIPSIDKHITYYSKANALFTIPLFFGFIFLLPNLISIAYGSNYVGKIEIYALIFSPWIVLSGFNLAYRHHLAKGKPKKIGFANAIVMIINTILDLILVPLFSVSGAMFASIIAYFFYFIYLNRPFFKYFNFYEIIKSCIASFIMLPLLFIHISGTFLVRLFLTLILSFLGAVSFYVVSYLFGLLNKDDIEKFLLFFVNEFDRVRRYFIKL